ncbi:CES2 [Bugula neritina]|uniref:Carboxylic ester hydrolase n=1 Tax=Bugula neritina TaxID=10212 RepID=A0A7J7J8L9_BUGNE|nr:CES2 [Bugula neritina]
MAFTLQTITAVCLLVYCTSAADPIVTLSHGGQLRGVSTTFLDSKVDLFLGVRYAKPPVGKLRFKKTEEAEGWKGVEDAKAPGSICPQIDPTTYKFAGEEDCLFMDITVPGGVQPGAKKPVMVWIPGGGFVMGSGKPYIGAALATTGDVITVSINYRLGVLGFLAIEKGTGNYGLWDQRAALLWIKQNIAQFGGDPDLVTIFGESAGGSSVSAHTIGQHSGDLFKRAIVQVRPGVQV